MLSRPHADTSFHTLNFKNLFDETRDGACFAQYLCELSGAATLSIEHVLWSAVDILLDIP